MCVCASVFVHVCVTERVCAHVFLCLCAGCFILRMVTRFATCACVCARCFCVHMCVSVCVRVCVWAGGKKEHFYGFYEFSEMEKSNGTE